MNSSTLQFVVVGALIAAWAWMLGRPVLTNLFRRSRRDSVGHFRYQQAVLGQSLFEDAGTERFDDLTTDRASGRPRPIADWRAQPVERRRLQLLLGFAISTFFSLLLAIALRDVFIRLFLLMLVCFAAYLCIAALIGASQLRRLEQEYAAKHRATGDVEDSALMDLAMEDEDYDPSVSILADGFLGEAPEPEVAGNSILDGFETYGDLESFGQGIFDDEFFEPIPELALRAQAERLEGLDGLDGEAAIVDEFFDEDMPADDFFGDDVEDVESDPDLAFDYVSPFEYKPLTEPGLPESVLWADLPEPEQPELGDLTFGSDVMADAEPALAVEAESEVGAEFEAEAEFEVGAELKVEVDVDTAPAGSSAEQIRSEPTFKAAPEQRARAPKRNKARPIYIESQLDEETESRKAVND